MASITSAIYLLSITLSLPGEAPLRDREKKGGENPYAKRLSKQEVEQVYRLLRQMKDPVLQTRLEAFEALKKIGPGLLPHLKRWLYAGNPVLTYHVYELYQDFQAHEGAPSIEVQGLRFEMIYDPVWKLPAQQFPATGEMADIG